MADEDPQTGDASSSVGDPYRDFIPRRNHAYDLFPDPDPILAVPAGTEGQDAEGTTHAGEDEPTESEKQAILDGLLPIACGADSIKSHLDTYVVGQEGAKVALSVLFSMHLRWFATKSRLHRAPNAMLIGPTGVGKTHTLKSAAEHLRLPFVVVDGTALVPSGAVTGQQIEDILTELVISADEMLRRSDLPRRFKNDDIALAERGIVFVDEFDKISDRVGGSDNNLSSWNRTTQRRLLKFVEGSAMVVATVREGVNERRSIDTSGILVIAGGAFEGIDSLSIRGLRSDEVTRVLRPGNEVIGQDVVNYGFIPELVARLPIIINFEALGPRALLEILRSEKVSPLGVWRNHFKQLGKVLEIERAAEVEVAKKAAALHMGARGLQQALFPLLASFAYEFESSDELKLTITPDLVKEKRNG